MKLTTLTLVASALLPVLADDGAGEGPDWATYTKKLPQKTIVVTRYLGTSTYLEGPEFYTRTVVVSKDGKPQYTEIITGHNTDTAAAAAAAHGEAATTTGYAPGQGPDWATYTKSLTDKTIVVTRYEGTETFLSGEAYNTKTVVVSKDGKALYTEIITGHNAALDGTVPTATAAPENKDESKAAEQSSDDSEGENKWHKVEEQYEQQKAEQESKGVSVDSFSGASLLGLVIGAAAVVGGAVVYLRRPKGLVQLPHQEV